MNVRHALGEYPVNFVNGIEKLVRSLPEDSVVITDGNVARHYGKLMHNPIVIEPGEGSKSPSAWAELQSSLARRGVSRKTTLVAFGGGVIGDLAGFVAATYMRGIPLIQVPTTLLAMVDSSVGGKVGIDLVEGKNLVGAFYPPKAVVIAPDTLNTLPEREFRNGMAEVWKYAFALDAALIPMLTPRLAAGAPELASIIERCIAIKADVVQEDEFETRGVRAKLNFGHTIGHAIERLTGYGPVLHGEAISAGMVVETRLGEILGMTPKGTAGRVMECLRLEGLPTTSSVLENTDAMIAAMRTDKKASAGKMAFSLLEGIGNCKLVENVEEGAVRAAMSA